MSPDVNTDSTREGWDKPGGRDYNRRQVMAEGKDGDNARMPRGRSPGQ